MRHYLDHPLLSWIIALSYTSGVCFVMLMPGEESLTGDLSHFFGGTDVTDALGHVLLFTILTLIWYRAIRRSFASHWAIHGAVDVGLVLGTFMELAQIYVPDRGVSLLDFLANWMGVVMFILGYILVRDNGTLLTTHIKGSK